MGLIKSHHPTWSRDQLVTQLLGTADNINSLNPDYKYLLGTGRINAYRALADSNVIVPQVLRLDSSFLTSGVLAGINKYMPNEVVDIGLSIQNCSHGVAANNLTVTLTTDDPDIQIVDGEYIGSIPADSFIDLIDEFKIQISSDAVTHLAKMSFNLSAEVPVVVGQVQEFEIFVNPDGILVWDGIENGQDYSGAYIRDYLVAQGYKIFYTTDVFPSNLIGLDALFLSFGNYDTYGPYEDFDFYMAANVEEYLESGGKVYLEGGSSLDWVQSLNSNLLSLFGLDSILNGDTHTINSLQGQDATITEGMLFRSSTQQSNASIDKYVSNSMGKVSFYEGSYGNVAVQSAGNYGQRTFCFSYTLSELVDNNPPSTRDSLIQRILDFFEVKSTSVENDHQLPTEFSLMQNYPNPFNPKTKISYEIPRRSFVTLKVYDVLGSKIITLVNKKKLSGSYTIEFDASSLSSGVYFYRMQADPLSSSGQVFVRTRKMVLIK